jgi:hypothetical protein
MRGRPTGQMTFRRRQVLEKYNDMVFAGESVSISRLSRECGFFDYRNAKRVLRDLQSMGKVKALAD